MAAEVSSRLGRTDGRNGGAQRRVWENLMEMERFTVKAMEEDQGTVALLLDLAKVFERVQKEYDFIVLVHRDIRPSGRRAFHHGCSVLGSRSMDRKMKSRAERSLDDAVSGGPNVETGERACRSSDV